MSLILYLFLGHFEHDGDVVRFSKSRSDRVYRPVVRKPLASSAINIYEVSAHCDIKLDDWPAALDAYAKA